MSEPDAVARERGQVFTYGSYEIDTATGALFCRYSLDGEDFEERVRFEGAAGSSLWSSPAAEGAARWVFLLAGVSYFKTRAPREVILPTAAVRRRLDRADIELLRRHYVDGLGEFAFRNDLDLSDLTFGGTATDEAPGGDSQPTGLAYSSVGDPTRRESSPSRPLVPFGGGIDSIVTAELVRAVAGDGNTALFIVSRPADRFDAIEAPASVAGLKIVRAERRIDEALLAPGRSDYFNGHVPVTGIISAMAVLAAVVTEHDAVVMSNEASASVGSLVAPGRVVNHQWSKGIEFEAGFRAVLARDVPGVDYFSLLRSASELWVARRFADLGRYHGTFRSCNRAFYADKSRRLEGWCGECDKCCFVDLILSPFMPRESLEAVFEGSEPLADSSLAERFRVLLALSDSPKPFDCVGDTAECRSALRLAAGRTDRQDSKLLQELAGELPAQDDPEGEADARGLGGPDFIPDAYAPVDLLG